MTVSYWVTTEKIKELDNGKDVVAATSGAPADAPAVGTQRFDAATDLLYIYNGTAWVSILLT